MQFHLIEVSIFLKTRVKDLELIARQKDLISIYRGSLVSGFVTILVYFDKLANNFYRN